MEVYYERILKLANCLHHKVDDKLLITFFWAKLVPYLWVAIAGMKQDILFHKEAAMTCKDNLGDANEYRKLLKPPPKSKKIANSKKSELVCG